MCACVLSNESKESNSTHTETRTQKAKAKFRVSRVDSSRKMMKLCEFLRLKSPHAESEIESLATVSVSEMDSGVRECVRTLSSVVLKLPVCGACVEHARA